MDGYVKKVMRDNYYNAKFHTIPSRTDKIIPRVKTCQRCKKRKVQNHHFFCDECWRLEQFEKIICLIINERKVKSISEIKKWLNKYKTKKPEAIRQAVINLCEKGKLKGGKKWEKLLLKMQLKENQDTSTILMEREIYVKH